MHPINPHNFGSKGIIVSFYNGTALVTNGYIKKQTGSNKFAVTDGTVTKKGLKLAPTTAIATAINATNAAFFTFQVEPAASGATGATFTPHYGVQNATVVNGGSGFNSGDVLALPGAGGGALTVATLNGTAVATVTVTPGDYSVVPLFTSPTTATRAAGTGATLTANYVVDSATIATAGTGYTAGDTLTLATSGTTPATIVVDTAPGGIIATFHVATAGSGVTALGTTRTVTGGTGTAATFNLRWKLLSVTSSGGSGYNVGDTLTFVGITATTTPTAHISVATAHAATTVVVDSPGSGITVAATSITTSTASATFNLTYTLLSVAASGGTGYVVNDQLVFNGMVATTHPTAHISTVSSGAATAVVVDTPGSGITKAATSVSAGVPTASQEYVSRIWDSKLRTTAGNTYKWSLGQSINGSAVVKTP